MTAEEEQAVTVQECSLFETVPVMCAPAVLMTHPEATRIMLHMHKHKKENRKKLPLDENTGWNLATAVTLS